MLYVPAEYATWPTTDATGFLVAGSQTVPEPTIEIHSAPGNTEDVFGSCMGGHLAKIPVVPNGGEGLEQAKANATRFVACYTACESIEDPGLVPELITELVAYHDRLWRKDSIEGIPSHRAGERPDDCSACFALKKAGVL